MAAPTTEVEFNCPWCNTRLALTRSDFERERAVLCPRCSNPIDLDIQRRLAKTTTPKPAPPKPAVPKPSAPPAPTAQTRRQITTPTPVPKPTSPTAVHAPSTRYSKSPADPIGADPKAPSSQAPGVEKLQDWSKPFDVDSNFGHTPRPAPIDMGSTGKTAPGMSEANPTPYGGKIRCESCGYENSKVPPEFSFGTVLKCAWCSKPLPQ